MNLLEYTDIFTIREADMSLLDNNNCILLIIDIQEKLVAALKDKSIVTKAVKLVKAADILGIPVILSEQYPKGLGSTVNEISSVLPFNTKKYEKVAFSLLKENNFIEDLKLYNKKQIIVCGIEAHICVYQTAIELMNAEFEITVAKDVCASRNEYEFNIGMDLIKAAGAHISCLEIILFELLKTANHSKFKEIQSLIK